MDWKKVKHFASWEWKNDPAKASPDLIRALDLARDLTVCDEHPSGVPIVVHVCWDQDGHAGKSYHYTGAAVDFHFSCDRLSYIEQFAILSSVPEFGAIGFYPGWSPCPGWHVDIRNKDHVLYWVRVAGEYHYGWSDLVEWLIRMDKRDS